MIDFEKIEKSILGRFEESMRETQQSPVWHGEGDVYVHTMMVVEALRSLPEFSLLNERRRHILTIAALMHDVGKTETTQMEDGEWKSPYHAPTGSRMTRELLWKEYGLCGEKEKIEVREAICQLIRYHSFPPHAIDTDVRRMHRIAANGLLVPDFNMRMLCMLSKADMIGRICDNPEQGLEKVALCEEMAREEGCMEGCYDFRSEVTRRAYLRGDGVWKEQELYDGTWGEVVMMSGLPGTGKDTWIARNLPGLPMVSLDEIRRERKISPEGPQGEVANIACERAKEYLRGHQEFVWNATSVTAHLREQLVSLCETYHARVRIVYLETDWATELERNRGREAVVPVKAIERMMGRMTLPEIYEARNVEWWCV